MMTGKLLPGHERLYAASITGHVLTAIWEIPFSQNSKLGEDMGRLLGGNHWVAHLSIELIPSSTMWNHDMNSFIQ